MGAVVGGAVGGVVLLLLVGLLVSLFIMRRRRSHTAPSAAYIAAFRRGETPTLLHPELHPRDSISPFRDQSVRGIPVRLKRCRITDSVRWCHRTSMITRLQELLLLFTGRIRRARPLILRVLEHRTCKGVVRLYLL